MRERKGREGSEREQTEGRVTKGPAGVDMQRSPQDNSPAWHLCESIVRIMQNFCQKKKKKVKKIDTKR